MTRQQPTAPALSARPARAHPQGRPPTPPRVSRSLGLPVALGAITLIVMVVGALVVTGVLPGPVGDAHPGAVRQLEPEASGDAGAVAQDLPDDSRMQDTQIDPFDDTHPAIAGLQADLRAALQSAARDAHARGVDLWVTSGYRTTAHQERLLEEAVARYGSLEEARRFVASPETSSHVSGDAVDIGPTDGADWMIRKGAAYGLCQTYANEMWHFELGTSPGGTCPTPRSDAAS